MASTKASTSKASKRLKINIIPPKQLFVDLTQDDTKTPSPKHQLSSLNAPNAPSKTPSTKGTSSSSIDYTSKSPTSSTSPSTIGYLNSPTSPPLRVPPPPSTQKNASMDITLIISPITPLDVQFNTPSSSLLIFGDDDEDDGASHASTPSPTTYLNSLKPLDYQQYDIPTSSEQDDDLLFERQTDLLNQTQQMHKELRGGFKSFWQGITRSLREEKEIKTLNDD
nr:hypothetical protein [Tanacetum cinerariifolium]